MELLFFSTYTHGAIFFMLNSALNFDLDRMWGLVGQMLRYDVSACRACK